VPFSLSSGERSLQARPSTRPQTGLCKVKLAFLVVAGLLPLSTHAQPAPVQQVPGHCIYPSQPLVDEASLHALDLTMGEELARFMNEAQAYSQCLDATKQQLNSEVDQYMQQYREAHPMVDTEY